MPRRRRDCLICSKKNLAKLSNHLADIHQLSGKERQHYLSKARSLSDQRNFTRPSKEIGKYLFGSPEMDDANEKGSSASENNEN